MEQLEINGIKINVWSIQRAKLYQPFLEQALVQLKEFLDSFRQGDVDSAEAEFVQFLPSLFEEILSKLADRLDEIVIEAIEKDQENIRKHPDWTNQLSAEVAKQKLEDYYEDGLFSGSQTPQFSTLLERYDLRSLINSVAQQFSRNISKSIQRAYDHRLFIGEHLLNAAQSSIILKNIQFMDSDLHRGGQEVLCLEFKRADGAPLEKDKVIYKPSTVRPDAQLVGRTDVFQNTELKRYSPSMIELINQDIDGEEQRLQTYVIYPCEDEETKEEFGFIEYLSHEPWESINLKQEIYDLFHELSPSERLTKQVVKGRLQKKLLELHPDVPEIEIQLVDNFGDYVEFRMLHRAQEKFGKAGGNDYILDADAEDFTEKRSLYSFQVGMLAAIAYVFRVSDVHIQNLIIHGLSPYLIDLEVSFQAHIDSLELVGCLDNQSGAMLSNTKNPKTIKVLFDIDGHSESISEIEKNRLYGLFSKSQEGGLQPCPPYREDFLFGFSRVLDIVAEHSSEFITRVQHPSITKMNVRVLPCGTTTLTNSRHVLAFTKTIKPDDFYAIQRQQLVIEWLNELKRLKEEKEGNPDSIIPRLTYLVIWWHTDIFPALLFQRLKTLGGNQLITGCLKIQFYELMSGQSAWN